MLADNCCQANACCPAMLPKLCQLLWIVAMLAEKLPLYHRSLL